VHAHLQLQRSTLTACGVGTCLGQNRSCISFPERPCLDGAFTATVQRWAMLGGVWGQRGLQSGLIVFSNDHALMWLGIEKPAPVNASCRNSSSFLL